MRAIFDHSWHVMAVAGEADAVNRMAAEVIDPLYRFVLYRVGRDTHLAEDVVQETLCRAIRDIEKYEPDRADGNIFPWLTGLARNEIRRALAQKPLSVGLETLWSNVDRDLQGLFARLDSEPFDEALLRRDETREMVGATMSQLPPHYREALEAKYVAGQSVRQIALATNVSEKAAESLLTRARKAFRATFVSLARNLEPIRKGGLAPNRGTCNP